MRIISGKYRGFRYHPPGSLSARPTTDRAREGLFNILRNEWDFSSLKVLDLFAGTGSFSFEMASHGCTDLTAVEIERKAIRFIKKTAEQLDIAIGLVPKDAYRYIQSCGETFDLIFADPPYKMDRLEELPQWIHDNALLNPGGWFILEHGRQIDLSHYNWLYRQRRYGTTIFSIFAKEE